MDGEIPIHVMLKAGDVALLRQAAAAHQMNMGSYSGTQPAYSFSFTAASLRPDLMRIAA
jgi:hypothetical protein